MERISDDTARWAAGRLKDALDALDAFDAEQRRLLDEERDAVPVGGWLAREATRRDLAAQVVEAGRCVVRVVLK